MKQTDRREIRRYLGMDPVREDPATEEKITAALQKMEESCRPAYIREYFDLSAEGDTVSFAGLTVKSENLSHNLKGCSEVCVLACTLGAEADRLIRRASVISAADGAVYQACGAAMAEAWCGTVNDMIREEAAERGLFCHPRYSPGYGDLSLEVQKDLFRIMPITKTIGVSLTDSLLMVPVKSVTALIGIGKEECAAEESRCGICSMKEFCLYRAGGNDDEVTA